MGVGEACMKKPMGCKWLYLVKDGTLERVQGEMVAKGLPRLMERITTRHFPPLSNSVRILLPLAGNFDWNLQQFDVKIPSYMGILKKKSIWKSHLYSEKI